MHGELTDKETAERVERALDHHLTDHLEILLYKKNPKGRSQLSGDVGQAFSFDLINQEGLGFDQGACLDRVTPLRPTRKLESPSSLRLGAANDPRRRRDAMPARLTCSRAARAAAQFDLT
ncbi:hypothetical protein EVAR_71318_1 [Eumeta japonica]|uniref:Uncharacterized protein n=1 Tax=Eumeta variegata TaxID=151549 RepID=A0A4C2AAL5_EUMVA|nr:hypothetical protein EVAR_71318_1 [Eumeta japonica]